MHIILGATGHVGAAAARALLERGEAVTVVSRDAKKASGWERRGARVAVIDVRDTAALREVFRTGRRLFLLNPPAKPSTDTDVEERRSVASIVAALAGSDLEKVVALSAYGAQPGEHLYDLGVLHEMEESLATQPIPTAVIRAAYYFSNWEQSFASAKKEGAVHTFFPTGFPLPMVDPSDIGRLGAELMVGPAENSGPHYIEGPKEYSPEDIANAFAVALHREVKAVETPRAAWLQALRTMGFSEAAAESFSNMTAATIDDPFKANRPRRGATTIQQYVEDLARRDTSA